MHCGQRLALSGIMLAQNGHSLGPAPGFRIHRFTWCTSRKIAKATITKVITVFRNRP